MVTRLFSLISQFTLLTVCDCQCFAGAATTLNAYFRRDFQMESAVLWISLLAHYHWLLDGGLAVVPSSDEMMAA